MKKLLLSTVVALFFAPTAHATDVSLSLTDPLIGHWCWIKNDDQVTDSYKRGVWDCDNNLAITHDGYHHYARHEQVCSFTRVRPLMSRDGYGYATRAECNRDGEGPKNVQNVEFRIVGGLLKYTMTSLCSVVGKDMPDGFLNLRTGTGLRYDVKARLITGDELASVNAERKGKWIRVKVLRLGIVGWLDEKYTDGSEFDCSADAMAESQ